MNLILTLISGLLPLAISELEKLGLPAQVGNLITGLGTVATGLVTQIGSSPVTAASVLAAISASIVALQTQLQGNQGASTALAYLAAADVAVQAGIAASKVTVVDPAALQPVVPA